MDKTFDPDPVVPPEIENAAQTGELVVFVGAGVSRLIHCPSWEQFADRVLEQLAPEGIDYYLLSQIQGIADPKKRLSVAQIIAKKGGIAIDYQTILKGHRTPTDIYSYLNAFSCAFVTTNYEKYLRPDFRVAEPEELWRFYGRDRLLGTHLDELGNVIHLHGCTDAPASMIVSMKEYLDHYSATDVQEFLNYLFRRKTVLFLGYGLEEIEVLEYILRRGGARAGISDRVTRYMLQGFFNSERRLYELLAEYYLESFGTKLIGFPKDFKNYALLTDIIASWATKLRFSGLELADEAVAIREEIRD